MKGHRYWECDQNAPPLWHEGAQNYADYNLGYSHKNIQYQDCGETNASYTPQLEAQNIPTPVEARNQGQGLPEITEGNENKGSGGAFTGPFSAA